MNTRRWTPFRPGAGWGAPWLVALLTVVVGANSSGEAATLDEGLLVFYPFNGNALDASPNGHHGTVAGPTLTEDRYGRPNMAYQFDGVDDYINIGNQVKPNFPLTVTAWVRPDSSSAGDHTIFRSDTWTATQVYGVLMGFRDGGTLYAYIGSGAWQLDNWRLWVTTTPGGVPVNQWSHIAVEWLGFDTRRFYVNGVLQPAKFDAMGNGTTIGASTANGAIGALDYVGFPAGFAGKLDEVRVYNRALSASEVLALAVEAPEVDIFPSSLSTNAGSTVVFTANAVGAPPLAYQWQRSGTNINGATGNTLTLASVRASDSGDYVVIVSNAVATNSATATLSVVQQAAAVCSMPAKFTNGVAFAVSIQVIPPEGTFAYAVEDQPPVGWAVSQISMGGSLKTNPHRVRWVFADGNPRTISYTLLPPADVGGTFPFVGKVDCSTGAGTTSLTVTGVRECYNEALRLTGSLMELLGETYVKITVTGTPGASYHILVADGLESGNTWRTNGAVTLTGGSADWLDSEGLGGSHRFYRAAAAQ